MSCRVWCATGVASVYYESSDGTERGTITTGGYRDLTNNGTKYFSFSVSVASGYSGYYISAYRTDSGEYVSLSSFPSNLKPYGSLTVGGVSGGGGGGGGGGDADDGDYGWTYDPTPGSGGAEWIIYYADGAAKWQRWGYNVKLKPFPTISGKKPVRSTWRLNHYGGNGSNTYQAPGTWVNLSSTNDIKAYIEYESASYAVRFDTNTGDTVTNMPSNLTNRYGNVQIPSNVPKRDGYRFDYWYDRNNTHYAPNGIINVTQNITLYAHWTQTTYHLYFNANTSDHVSQIPNTVDRAGAGNVTIPSNVPLRDFYRFTEWNANSSGTGLAYQPGATYSLLANATLYAIWQRIWTHTITYDANNGFFSTYGTATTKSFDYDGTTSSFYITIKTRSELGALRTGYTFTGWNDVASGTGSSFIGGNSYSFSGDYTLYAQWTPSSYTITLDPNGGDIGGSSRPRDFSQNYGTTFTFQDSYEPTRAGYNFLGWSYGGLTKQSGDTWTVTNSATWTAIWSEPLLFHITFDGNGGTTAMGNYQYIAHGYYGDTIDLQTITSNFNERDGYQLYGWDSDSSKSWNGNLEYYTVGTLTIRGNRTVYAIWSPAYTVTYMSQGRIFEIDDSKYLPNDYVNITSNVPIWGSHVLKGWDTSGYAQTVVYTSGQSMAFQIQSDVTLYAVWRWEEIDPFYWTGSYGGDLAVFQTGLPVENAITASGWNNLITKINTLIQRAELSVSTSAPNYASGGMSITASLYNAMRSYIIAVLLQMAIGTAYYPPQVSTGEVITPYHFAFEGTNSLQGAVNHAISVFNQNLDI